jgi:hypothetical protein
MCACCICYSFQILNLTFLSVSDIYIVIQHLYVLALWLAWNARWAHAFSGKQAKTKITAVCHTLTAYERMNFQVGQKTHTALTSREPTMHKFYGYLSTEVFFCFNAMENNLMADHIYMPDLREIPIMRNLPPLLRAKTNIYTKLSSLGQNRSLHE